MKKSIRVLLGLIAILLLLLVVYFFMNGRKFEFFSDGATTVVFYHLKGCPHCVSFQPEWDAFVKHAKEAGIVTKDFEATENRELVESKNITGFPTIHVEKDGKVKEYTGNRTAKDLMAFVKSL